MYASTRIAMLLMDTSGTPWYLMGKAINAANAATHATMRNISLISTVLTGLGIGENVQ